MVTRNRTRKRNNWKGAGFSLLEVILALSVMAAVLIPLLTQLPGIIQNIRNVYIRSRLVYIAGSMLEHYARWGNDKKTDLDDFVIEHIASTMRGDIEAGELEGVIGETVHIPRRYRMHTDTFETASPDKLGFIITVYYDQDASKSLTDADVQRLVVYTLSAERGY